MNRYLKDCYCNGLPPVRMTMSGLFERNALVSRMMLKREQVRVLCAPSMMGKTSLACQYARMAFSFDKVLWLDATHPCLLRGLYGGNLLEAMEEVLREGSLIVFEDVPCLSGVSRERFVELCSKLLDREMEVIVTCCPDANPFAKCDLDLALIGSEDLLYSDSELEELRRRGCLHMGFRGAMSRSERVPGLLNRVSGSVERFLMLQQSEAGSPFQQLLNYALVLLSTGTLADLSLIMGRPVSVKDLKAPQSRPYVDLSEFGEVFFAGGFPQGDVLRVLRSQLSRICANSQEVTPERFVTNLADVLIANRAVDKATRLMVEACGPDVRAQWAARHMESMVEMSAPLYACVICKSLEGQGRVLPARFRLWNAVAHLLFAETATAFEELSLVASDSDNDLDLRIEAAAFAAIISSDHPSDLNFGSDFGSACLELRKRGRESNSLQVMWNSILDGTSGIKELIESAEAGCHSPDWLLAATCCLHGIAVRRASEDRCLADERKLPHLLDCIGSAFEDCMGEACSETRLHLLKCELDSLGSGPYLSRATMSLLDQVEARIRAQRASFGKLPSSIPWGRSAACPSDDILHFDASSASVMSVPVLEVKMFGRFEVCIGGQPVDQRHYSRLKVRSLIALLVLEEGKEVACERLAELLWPESTGDKAYHNFDSIYSMMRRSLTLQDGSCPYLKRMQGVCKVNAPFVKSDAGDLREICRQLRYGSFREEDAMVLFERLKGVYQGELIPGKHVVPSIEAARSTWRCRVVDALLAASAKLFERGFSSAALDFALFALSCDNQREDVYEAVMSLQYAKNQRNNAIETFFEYQRMNRELGLDPSARMRALYESIIADEELPWGLRFGVD